MSTPPSEPPDPAPDGAGMQALALQWHAQGELTQAANLFRELLRLDPQHFLAAHQLGVIQIQLGDFGAAIESLHRALTLAPKSPIAHFNLGSALWGVRRAEEALAHYQYALVLKPAYPEALLNCAVVLRYLGRQEEALARLERLQALTPGDPAVHLNLGIVLQELQRHQAAVACFERVLELETGQPEALMNLGNSLLVLGRASEALARLDQALRAHPDWPEALTNRGNALVDLGRPGDALADFDLALSLQPGRADFLNNRSNALRSLNRNQEALESCELALASEPGNTDALVNRGTALHQLGRHAEAIASLEAALAIQPDLAAAHSNAIFILDYLEEPGFQEHQAARARYFQAQAKHLVEANPRFGNDRNPTRPLVLGYVSADFKNHSAAFCFSPILKHHDKKAFKVICYSGVVVEDAWTARFKGYADTWRTTVGRSDEDVAAMIRADEVDILIDLSGHSKDNRLPVFARKPAPIQVTAWGHGGGTGLPLIDYQFTDPIFTPHAVRALYAEESYDLPCCITFEPPPSAIPVADLPALANGHLTFGSLNRFNKVSERTLDTWLRILELVPQSRLLLKSACFDGPQERSKLREKFVSRKLDPDRLLTQGSTSREAHLAAYNQVDLILDTFPQNGGVTTWEALWMEVPVISMAGNKPPSLVSAAILHALGLGSWVAGNDDEYQQLAVRKASDLTALAELRRGLRARIEASPAGNARLYTQAVEAGYRAMWARWVSQQGT